MDYNRNLPARTEFVADSSTAGRLSRGYFIAILPGFLKVPAYIGAVVGGFFIVSAMALILIRGRDPLKYGMSNVYIFLAIIAVAYMFFLPLLPFVYSKGKKLVAPTSFPGARWTAVFESDGVTLANPAWQKTVRLEEFHSIVVRGRTVLVNLRDHHLDQIVAPAELFPADQIARLRRAE